MRFEEAYDGWKRGRLTQEEAARLLGVCDRTYRRYLVRYDEQGWRGLVVNLSLKAMHFCYNDVAALLQNTFRIWGKKDGGAAFWHLIGRLKKVVKESVINNRIVVILE